LAGDVADVGAHATPAAADDDGLVAQFGPVPLFHRGVEGVAVEVGDVQLVQLVMADHAARITGGASVDLAVAGPEAVAADGFHALDRAMARALSAIKAAAPRGRRSGWPVVRLRGGGGGSGKYKEKHGENRTPGDPGTRWGGGGSREVSRLFPALGPHGV